VSSLELDNIELELSNLIVDLDQLFPPGRVHRFYINFPDPWFKERQHNRRWLSEETVPHLVAALEPGGEIFFQSDVWSLSLEALALLEAVEGVENTCGAWTFLRKNPYPVSSSRELVCQQSGREIWRLLFSRLSPS
jgi:tRNA (guanine-N7-)-methyltransferase